jgi:hypothetical protein
MEKLKINSISGGKTSCFMALNFKADYNVFACVELKDMDFKHKISNKERHAYSKSYKYIRMQLGEQFQYTAEDDKTLDCLMKLELEIEQKSNMFANHKEFNIKVISSSQYRQIRKKYYDDFDYLPNSRKRICTETLKIDPIYRFTKDKMDTHGVNVCEMAIGFRLDEIERTVNLYFKSPPIKNRIINPSFDMQALINLYKIPSYVVKWWDRLDVEKKVKKGDLNPKKTPFNYFKKDFYRTPTFPLIEQGITRTDIEKFWKGKTEYTFPKISNCIGCFHHTVKELKSQWNINANKMEWFSSREKDVGKTFLNPKFNLSYDGIKHLPDQIELFEDFGGSCDSAGCTD